MTITPRDNYLVTVESKYTEEIILGDGIKLFIDPSYRPEHNVTVLGKVASISKNNPLNLSIGDEIFFSYVVIGQRDYTPTGNVFHSLFEEHNERFQRYRNGKGESLNIVAMPGIIGLIWVGTHLSDRGELISGCQGSESEVSRWKSQFTIGAGGGYKYKNLLNIEGKEHWIVKPELVFARRKGKKLEPLGDRLILKPLKVEVPKDILREMKIKIPDSAVYTEHRDKSELQFFDKKTGYKKGTIIGYEPKYLESYIVDGEKYQLLRTRRVLGTYEKN